MGWACKKKPPLEIIGAVLQAGCLSSCPINTVRALKTFNNTNDKYSYRVLLLHYIMNALS